MDGWMDGWLDGWICESMEIGGAVCMDAWIDDVDACMDGEVLIIGEVVGWSGWVPKGLVCGEPPTVHGV